MNLWDKDRYAAPYDYLINSKIYEYDISKANISILNTYNVINQKQYEYYYNLPKQQREIQIGLLLQKNRDISKVLSNGFKESRRIFIESNQIPEENILYIDKDSITVFDLYRLDSMDSFKVSDKITFLRKNIYSSYFRLGNGVDFLYYNNGKSTEYYRFKGMGKSISKFMNTDNSFLWLLLSIAYSGQYEGIVETIQLIKDIYHDYINFRFHFNYYKEFNQSAKFRINTPYQCFYSEVISINDLDCIDITYNATLLRRMYQIFTREYLLQKAKELP